MPTNRWKPPAAAGRLCGWIWKQQDSMWPRSPRARPRGPGADMGGGLKVGLTQWHATADIEANVAIAVVLIGKAAAEGASLVVLPENGLMLGTNTQMRARLLSESC